ncbi:translation initiation factor IF-2 subunit alpha, partial [mine drainage metagenome]
KYIRDYIREGQKIVGRVIHLDHDKGQVDLSLKRINEHQRREKLQAFKNEQRAQKLVGVWPRASRWRSPQAMATFGGPLLERYGSLVQRLRDRLLRPRTLRRGRAQGSLG